MTPHYTTLHQELHVTSITRPVPDAPVACCLDRIRQITDVAELIRFPVTRLFQCVPHVSSRWCLCSYEL